MNMITATVRYNDNYADIDFPCSDIYLYSKLMELHADDPNNTTLFVSEIIEPEELSCLKDRFVNLDELNYLAKRMESFFGDEEIQFYEALKLEHFTELKDFINLSFNLDKYTLIQDVSDMGKVWNYCRMTIRRNGLQVRLSIPQSSQWHRLCPQHSQG